jgi:hypothetical protein
MKRLLPAVAILCALTVSGCQTLQPAPVAIGARIPPARPATKADAAVARTSEQLARYCGLTRAATAAVGLFASPKVQQAADYASAVLDTVCASPPTDVRTALDTVGRAYTAVITASQEGEQP